jgi:hypothetical protein
MSNENVFTFLRTVATRPDLLDTLKTRSKDEILQTAAEFGLPFTHAEFDDQIWGLEGRLAAKRGEEFDASFPLWSLMWGKYYLEYLVVDLLPSFDEARLPTP